MIPAGPVLEAFGRSVLTNLAKSPAFRVAPPVPALDGSWTFDGWQACGFVPGAADPSRVDDILRAATAFHDTLAGLPRPSFLDTRDDPWTYGDHVAWGCVTCHRFPDGAW